MSQALTKDQKIFSASFKVRIVLTPQPLSQPQNPKTLHHFSCIGLQKSMELQRLVSWLELKREFHIAGLAYQQDKHTAFVYIQLVIHLLKCSLKICVLHANCAWSCHDFSFYITVSERRYSLSTP